MINFDKNNAPANKSVVIIIFNNKVKSNDP